MLNTFDTPLAMMLARSESPSLATTPTSLTSPFFTMMWMDGMA